jgi:predicted nucleic acid-binding protein
MGAAEERPMSTYVIDASVLFKTLIREPDSNHADALVASAHIVVPEIAFAEVGNAIWALHRRTEMSEDVARGLIDDFSHAAFEVHSNRPQLTRAFAMAAILDHPIHDCIYLALAERLDVPLITADHRLIAALRKKGFATSRVFTLGEPI